ncbi:MAG: response regulator [bacterium]|nr:response regulator [bacterium]MCY4258454.1 response regulator [bacterium]
MTRVLLATDSDSVHQTIDAALRGYASHILRVSSGAEVRHAVQAHSPDVVICDLQIANMGGVATSLDLRMEADMGRLPNTRILLLLDREADIYLARQAKVDAWLLKPLDAVRLQQALASLAPEPAP